MSARILNFPASAADERAALQARAAAAHEVILGIVTRPASTSDLAIIADGFELILRALKRSNAS